MYVRSIRLEDVCDTSDQKASNESVVKNVLPAFLHVLLAGLDTEQPAGGRIIVVTVVRGTETGPGRECLGVLRLAKQAARPEDVRQWPGSHLEDGGQGGLRPILACEEIGEGHKGESVLLNPSGKDGLN